MKNLSNQFGNKKILKSQKTTLVQNVFTTVSNKYDLMNDLMSLGTHRLWKKELIELINVQNNQKIIDVGSGTGDIGFEILKHQKVHLTNIDISRKMLDIAKKKAHDKNHKKITFIEGDAENLPIENESVDYITIAYGFRNIANHEIALKEFFRVLKPGGKLGILDFSIPKSSVFSLFFKLQFIR